MIISCGQCSTTYTLDDSLIPASGASVQCTRCGNVFLAKKEAAGPAARIPPAPPSRPKVPSVPAAGSKTMIFGGDSAPKTEPGAAATNKTMIFGGDGPKPAPATNKTMIFGGEGPKPAAAPATNRTMIFGGSPPGSSGEDKPATNKTMIFGGESKAAAAKTPAANPGSRTMIFGGAPVLDEAKTDTKPAVPAPAANPGNKTMIFGGSAPGPEPKSKPRAGSSTMMFGAAPPLPESDDTKSLTSRTMQFGGPGQAPVTDDSGQLVFGADAARDKPGVLTDGTVRIDQAELERMRLEHEGGAAPAPGPGSLMDEDELKASAQKTQLFGGASSTAKTEPPPRKSEGPATHQKTQLFGGGLKSPSAAPPPVSEFDDFAAAIAAEDDGKKSERTGSTDPELDQVAAKPGKAPVDSSIVDTLEPDKVAPLPPKAPPVRAGRRVTGAVEPPKLSPPELIATTLPNREALPPPGAASAGLELPPEGDAPALFNEEAVAALSPADEAMALKAQRGRRNKVAALIVIAVTVVLALGIAWVVVGRQLYGKLTGSEIPIEALTQTEQVVGQLKADDAARRKAAAESLRALIVQHPRLLEAQAGLVTALALDLDEAQDRARRFAVGSPGTELEFAL